MLAAARAMERAGRRAARGRGAGEVPARRDRPGAVAALGLAAAGRLRGRDRGALWALCSVRAGTFSAICRDTRARRASSRAAASGTGGARRVRPAAAGGRAGLRGLVAVALLACCPASALLAARPIPRSRRSCACGTRRRDARRRDDGRDQPALSVVFRLARVAVLPHAAPPASYVLSVAPLLLYLDPLGERFRWPSLIYVPASCLPCSIGGAGRRRAQPLSPSCRQGAPDACRAEGSAPLFRAIARARDERAESPPVCLYLEVTNRCNLLCETCPRTFEALEPPADMSWELFTRIVDQVPGHRARRAARRRRADAGARPAAHDPLSQGSRRLRAVQHQRHAAATPRRSRADRDRPRRAARLARCRRCRRPTSRCAARISSHRIVRDVGALHRVCSAQPGPSAPRVSLWLTGLKETVQQLPEFVRLAARDGRARGASATPRVR